MSRVTIRRQPPPSPGVAESAQADRGAAPRLIALAVLVGVAVEGAAAVLGAYTYRASWVPIVVVVAGFGGVLGGTAVLTGRRPLPFQFLAGAACGVAAELANALWVHAWVFAPSIQRVFPTAEVRALILGVPLGLVVVGLNWIITRPHAATALRGPRKRAGAAAEPALTAEPSTAWLPDAELAQAGAGTVFRLVFRVSAAFLRDSTALLIGSTFIVLMVWGPHGDMEMLRWAWSGWSGPGSDPAMRAAPHLVPWDQEWISFAGALVLLVGVPALLIRMVFRDRLGDYGLGLPPRGRRRLALWSALTLLCVALPIFVLAVDDPSMRSAYPVFRGNFPGFCAFLLYEAGCLAFFVAIEFVFRGYLLFGLFRALVVKWRFPREAAGGYAILLSMLAYTTWHLGKPIPELWGTLLWGIAAGTLALAMESIWPIIVVHWLLNVLLDFMIVRPW